MSILKAVAQTKESGFKPGESKINDSISLPSGDYPVRIKQVVRGATRSGHEQVEVTLEVVSGEHKNRLEYVNLAFYDTLPDFVIGKNTKILLAIAHFADVELSDEDLKDEESTAKALEKGVGKQFRMKLRLTQNKKNPDYPYRNYEFEALDDAPDSNLMDADEDDLDPLPEVS